MVNAKGYRTSPKEGSGRFARNHRFIDIMAYGALCQRLTFRQSGGLDLSRTDGIRSALTIMLYCIVLCMQCIAGKATRESAPSNFNFQSLWWQPDTDDWQMAVSAASLRSPTPAALFYLLFLVREDVGWTGDKLKVQVKAATPVFCPRDTHFCCTRLGIRKWKFASQLGHLVPDF